MKNTKDIRSKIQRHFKNQALQKIMDQRKEEAHKKLNILEQSDKFFKSQMLKQKETDLDGQVSLSK